MQRDDNTQRQLALGLIDAMGIERAVDIARRNYWDGVLAEFLILALALDKDDRGQSTDRPAAPARFDA